MKKILKSLFIFSTIITLASCGISSSISSSSQDQNVTVALLNDERSTIEGDSVKTVTKGEDVTFQVAVEDGYSVTTSDDLLWDYSTEILTVKEVQYSKTIQIETERDGSIHITIENDDRLGKVSISPNQRSFDPGEEVTITVESDSFTCLSYDKSIHKENDSGKAFSYTKETTFAVENDLNIYVNYVAEDNFKITYEMNGGKTFQNQDSLFIDYQLNAYHVRPNSMLNDEKFFKENCTLESYNTKADGSGTRIGIGSRIDVGLFDENKAITLYCQWVEWDDSSDYEFIILEDGTYAVSGYSGSSDTIIIPGKYDGAEVTKVLAGSFVDVPTLSVVFPDSIDVIEKGAFSNCQNLFSILFWSSLTEVYGESFSECPKLDQLSVNANVAPRFSTQYARGYLGDKLDRIIEARKDHRIIVSAGSSTIQYNHDFAAMNTYFDETNCYTYNFGLLGAFPLKTSLNILFNIIGENDVVFAVCQEGQLSRQSPAFLFEYLECNWDDMRNFINYSLQGDSFLDYWPTYKKSVLTLDEKTYENYDYAGLTAHGDCYWSSEPVDETNAGTGVLTIPTYQSSMVEWIDEMAAHFNISKERFYLTFSYYNKNNVQSVESFETYEEFLRTNIQNASFFDTIDDHILGGQYFRKEDTVHLNDDGGLLMSRHYGEILSQLV